MCHAAQLAMRLLGPTLLLLSVVTRTHEIFFSLFASNCTEAAVPLEVCRMRRLCEPRTRLDCGPGPEEGGGGGLLLLAVLGLQLPGERQSKCHVATSARCHLEPACSKQSVKRTVCH